MVYVEQDNREPVIADRVQDRWPTRRPKQRSPFMRWFLIGGLCAIAFFVVLVVMGWNTVSSILSSVSL